MASVEGLRGAYELVGGLAHFGRMLDKIRLHAKGKLPADYVPFLGVEDRTSFDGRICRSLRIDYSELAERTKRGGGDDEILEWAYSRGRKPSEEEIEIITAFISKRGWRDEASEGLRRSAAEAGIPAGAALTFPDLMDLEEGRPLRFGADPPPFSGKLQPSASIDGLRSPYEKVGGIVHFGRMLDKIRIHREGRLPSAWVSAMGGDKNFDGICCRFLDIGYPQIAGEALKGGRDEDLLEWAFARGRKPSDEEILIWNAYLSKRGWRDQYTSRLHFRLEEAGMPIGAALTMFDYIDMDEGRPLRYSIR